VYGVAGEILHPYVNLSCCK